MVGWAKHVPLRERKEKAGPSELGMTVKGKRENKNQRPKTIEAGPSELGMTALAGGGLRESNGVGDEARFTTGEKRRSVSLGALDDGHFGWLNCGWSDKKEVRWSEFFTFT
jgi:hypothetical protein